MCCDRWELRLGFSISPSYTQKCHGEHDCVNRRTVVQPSLLVKRFLSISAMDFLNARRAGQHTRVQSEELSRTGVSIPLFIDNVGPTTSVPRQGVSRGQGLRGVRGMYDSRQQVPGEGYNSLPLPAVGVWNVQRC